MTYLEKRPVDFFRDFDRSLENFFGGNSMKTRIPSVDVKENENSYIIEAELPGLTEKDVEVKVENKNLFISTVKEDKKEEKKENYLIRERSSYSFSRNFILPEDADAESITGTFKNGILTLEIGKKPEKKPKSIKIKAA